MSSSIHKFKNCSVLLLLFVLFIGVSQSSAMNQSALPAGTVLFFDDFSDGVSDGWTPRAGSWEVTSSEPSIPYSQILDPGGNHNRFATFYTEQEFTDFELEVDITSTSSVQPGYFNVGVAFRADNAGNYYRAVYHPTQDRGSRLWVAKIVNDQVWPHIIFDEGDYVSGPVSTFRVVARGNIFEAYIDDRFIASWVDHSYPSGFIGLTAENGSAQFDNVTIRTPNQPSNQGENLLLNPSFEEGVYDPTGNPASWTKYSFNNHYDAFHWDDSEAIHGEKSAKISIDELDDIRWQQTVKLKQFTDYRLSGWIKTENVSGSPQAVQAGANLSIEGDFEQTPALLGTNDWTYVSLDFNTGSRTQVVISARIGMYSGITTGTAWFDNLRLEEFNVIKNPSFEEGESNWKFYTNGNGFFRASTNRPWPDPGFVSPYSARIVIREAGDNIQLYQHGIMLEPYTTYRLTFGAFSNTGHDLKVYLHDHSPNYTNYGLRGYRANLSTSWQMFEKTFTTSGFDNAVDDARLRFWLAPFSEAGDIYYIDHVVLEKVE